MADTHDTVVTRWDAYRQRGVKPATPTHPIGYAAYAYGGPNIGDDIQSLAAIRFLPRVDYFVYRENLNAAADHQDAFLIGNAWYNHRLNVFIPPRNLRTLYVAVHLRHEGILTRAVVNYLKRHEPIGCRDYPALEMMRARGIDCYFSGCLTLTLENPAAHRGQTIVISDLDPKCAHLVPEPIRRQATTVTHDTTVGVVDELSSSHQFSQGEKAHIKASMWAQRILPAYEALHNATLRLPGRNHGPRPDPAVVAQRHELARQLLHAFGSARLVVTSRLHCALPCLALGTPVVMLHGNPADARFLGINKYLKIHGPDTPPQAIDWNPAPVDISEIRNPLIDLVTEAVRIQRNPLSNGM